MIYLMLPWRGIRGSRYFGWRGMKQTGPFYAELVVVLTHFFKINSLFRFSVRSIDFSKIRMLVENGFSRAACMAGRSLLPVLMNTLVLKIALDNGVTAMSAQSVSSYLLKTSIAKKVSRELNSNISKPNFSTCTVAKQ